MSSKRLKFVKRRRALGLTQKQVADAAGVTSRTVQSWELGENSPRLTLLQTLDLCELMQCTVEELAQDLLPDEYEAWKSGVVAGQN